MTENLTGIYMCNTKEEFEEEIKKINKEIDELHKEEE
jgi:hypothetical protein